MTQAATKKLIDLAEVRRTLNILAAQGQVTELRILNATTQSSPRYPYTASGYFSDTELLIKELSTLRTAQGVYITLQPCKRDLLARAKNRLRSADEMKNAASTADNHIERYHWLLIDCDPERPAGISSSDEEHERALARVQEIRRILNRMGWPEPIDADSGNGGHLDYRIDLPITDSALIQRVLIGLAGLFDIEGLHIDQTVYNPSRISKLYGTLACKGDDTDERPHRMSRILSIPESIAIVPRELLVAMAAPEQPKVTNTNYRSGSQAQEFDIEDFIRKHNLDVTGPKPWNGGDKWVFSVCPWNSDHTDRSAYILRFPSGAIAAGCQHNGCSGLKWQDLRTLYAPDAYTPKNKPTSVETPDKDKKAKNANGDETSTTKAEKKESTQALLMRIADRAKYICTPSGALYARVPVNGHHEIVSISEHGSGFRRWLVFTYKSLYGIAPNSDAISLVMSGVIADAEYKGEKAKVHTRIAEHNGCIYLDLANEKWQCVEISDDGYRVIICPPVYFRRPNGMLPLPEPKPGGNLDDLRKIINAKEDKDYVLILSWLIGTLHPTGPYAVLNLNGERGSAKTKVTALLRKIVDPNEALTRSIPKDLREAAIMAQNNMIVALDNLSSLQLWFSDTLCRISTGSGYTTRALYSDDEEVVFSAKRPIILNGIEDGLVSQGDLLNRTIIVTLKPPDAYLAEEDIDALFDEMHPRLLGALLAVASFALRNRKNVRLDKPPRLADFAKWVTSIEPALNWQSGTFMSVFTENQENASSIVSESSPLAKAITQFMQGCEKWKGYTSELFDQLSKYEVFTKAKKAPKNARALSGQLKRIAPALRVQGIDIQQLRRDKSGSPVVISKTPQPDVANDGADVANEPLNVANDGAEKDFAPPDEPALHVNGASQNGVGVANVAKMQQLSTIYPPIQSEKKRESEKTPDNDRNFATSHTFATQPQEVNHYLDDEEEEVKGCEGFSDSSTRSTELGEKPPKTLHNPSPAQPFTVSSPKEGDPPLPGIGRRCRVCKRNEAVVWWPDDVPRCQDCMGEGPVQA